ncbi:hypothetical protein H9P43_009701 [Blastocladiella emersonii ATCC 22665]|nr:hypothetical protein H9P43_009701 [Blastocladiella emersonii ATCC 22665]
MDVKSATIGATSPPTEPDMGRNANNNYQSISSSSDPAAAAAANASPSAATRTAAAAPEPPRRLLGVLYLHPSFSPANFAVFLVATLLTVCMFVFLSSGTTFVLSEILGLQSGEGDAAGGLAFYDEILSMAMVLLWGSVSDLVGRRAVYAVGFATMGAGLIVYPLATNLYPQLLLARLLFAVGAAACSCMLTAVLADCAGKLRGRISGLVGLMSGLGALVGVFVLLPLPTSFEKKGTPLGRGVQYTFAIAGGVSIVFGGIFYLLASKHFGARTTEADATAAEEERTPLLSRLAAQIKHGAVAAKDLRIMAAYAAGFAARGNTVIITTFIPLWINKYYIENGLCQISGLDPNNETAIKASCRIAFTRSSIIGGVTQTFALIGAPLWGILMDKLGSTDGNDEDVALPDSPESGSSTTPVQRRASVPADAGWLAQARAGRFATLPLLLTCVIAFVGYLLLFFVRDPTTGAIFPVTFLVGFGEIGTVITSVAMVAAGYIDPKIRGSVAGAYSLCGGLGIMLCTRIGGLLFDSWTFTAPFLLMALVHGFVAVLSLAVIVKDAAAVARGE